MGLDMFAYATFADIAGSVDFDVKDATQLHYWRKHPDLHGWMSLLYREKDGSNSEFNCVNVRLDERDLDQLEADIKEKRLPRTAGFFFGESDGSESEDDLAFIGKAREALITGATVFYTSWW